MKTDRGKFPAFPGLDRADAGFLSQVMQYGPRNLKELSSRDLGRPVKAGRSSWVRCLDIGSKTYYVKTYDYPTLRAQARGWLRNTAFAETRPEREYRALRWLASRGFSVPDPAAVWIERRGWGVGRACLVTSAWPGDRVDHLLSGMSEAESHELLLALRTQVEAMHSLGYRDRNLDLRNILARREESGAWLLAKIDSPRFRIVAAGKPTDRLAREDWSRLRSSLARFGPLAALID